MPRRRKITIPKADTITPADLRLIKQRLPTSYEVASLIEDVLRYTRHTTLPTTLPTLKQIQRRRTHLSAFQLRELYTALHTYTNELTPFDPPSHLANPEYLNLAQAAKHYCRAYIDQLLGPLIIHATAYQSTRKDPRPYRDDEDDLQEFKRNTER